MAQVYATQLTRASTQYWSRSDTFGLSRTDNITVAFWVKLDSNVSGSLDSIEFITLGFAEAGMRLGYEWNGGTPRITIGWHRWFIQYHGDSYNVNLGTTAHHIALTKSGSTFKLYVDGALVKTSGLSQDGGSGVSATSTIGTGYNNGSVDTTKCVNGQMDDVRIWQRTLSDSDVSTQYSSPCSASNGSNLMAWYEYENNGNDSSGNSRTLTNNNTATFTTSIPYTCSISVTPTPSTLSCTFSLPTYSVAAIQSPTVTPATLSASFSLPAYTVTPQVQVTLTPATLSATFSLPTYIVTAPDTEVTADPFELTFSIPAYTVTPQVNISPSPTTLELTFSIPSYTVSIGAEPQISPLTATFTVPPYAVFGQQQVEIEATTLEATFSFPSYAVGLGIDIDAVTLEATFSIPVYTVAADRTIEVLATTLVASFSLPATEFVGGVWKRQPIVTDEWDKMPIGE